MQNEKEICAEGCDEVSFLSHKILDLNKKLIESEKTKTRFLALVSSELNNPMTALLGMIPHVKQQSGGENEAVCALIHQEALTLDFRIQNLVAAAQIEGGEIDITDALVDPAEVVAEAVESLKYLIRETKVDVRIVNELKHKIVSDPQKLYLIVKNLVANGCTYGIEGGVIEIVIKECEGKWKLSVKNRGEGPEVEHKPQIFTRFSEGPDGKHGLGIGLSIVRDFSERMDGNVDYTAEGGEVVFTVTFPLHADRPDSEACGSNEFLFESFDGAIEF